MMFKPFLWLLLWLLGAGAAAAEPPKQTTLPDPLTLEAVLKQADQTPPQVLLLRAKAAMLAAQQQQAATDLAPRVRLSGTLGRHEFQGHDHAYHTLYVNLSKLLYDQDRSAALRQALATQQSAYAVREQDVRQRYRRQLMRAFFDIILADLDYRRLNEKMAVVYVRLDRLRDRHKLGTVSDVDLARQEKDYQALLLKRDQAEKRQRETRVLLALLMGRPQAVIDAVAPPKLAPFKRPLPPLEKLLARANRHALALQALRTELAALQYKAQWARHVRPITLTAIGRGGIRHYENETDKDHWNVALQLNVPLYDGGETDATLAQVASERLQRRAQLAQAQQDVRQRVVKLWRQLASMNREKDFLKAYSNFVDLNFMLKQGLYENEERTDLGDAMIEQSEYDYRMAEARFRYVLLWQELDDLTGGKQP